MKRWKGWTTRGGGVLLVALFTAFCAPVLNSVQPVDGESESPNETDSPLVKKAPEADGGESSGGSVFSLNRAQLESLADQIFLNEAGGNREKLFFWNPNEAFPSLGIGHFIWFRKNDTQSEARFGGDSFPTLVRFLQSEGEELPTVLKNTLPELDCPWPSRSAFLNAPRSTREQMISFLERTKHLQMKHIVQRFDTAMESFRNGKNGSAIDARIQAVAKSPAGPYPLIDYVNFKGEGTAGSTTSWGLWNVLDEMNATSQSEAHKEFARAADVVLTRRVRNNPEDRRWLEGWRNRLKTYESFRM